MCGICGVINYNTNFLTHKDLIGKMCAKLTHRGPDGEGINIVRNVLPFVGLGHRRLSIIDLSQAGRQPMPNEDGTIWIVFNGEIYNYRELRKDLQSRGHRFNSNTDTETIIHLYEEYHQDCLKYLRGMFAFALWDSNDNTLFLARDRVGKKPLLYYYDNGVFIFASEFSSILASEAIKKEINYEAIQYYLSFGYIPAPLTIYKHIFKLMPAESIMLKGRDLKKVKYWHLDYSKKITISKNEAADEVLRLLTEATKIRLYSEVPLGAFLSGGIDSSAVVALMSQLSDTRVKTFSIGFDEKGYSELRYARNIAERFNTEHHEFIVKPKALEVLPLLVERYGEPYADSSCIPTYYVSRETKQYVTVALNGDGGDELFAGYERYQAMLAVEAYQKLPKVCRGLITGILKSLPDSVNPKDILRNIKRVALAMNLPAPQRYLRWVGIFDTDLKNSLYSKDFKNKMLKADPTALIISYFDNFKELSLVDRLLMIDTNTYLPGDLLVKVDIASMANSLEARSPFLDHKLMEFVASLPAEYKMKRLIKKYLLKRVIKDLVPAENIHRRKMGFGVPIGSWFRNELKDYLENTLFSKIAFNRGYFNPEAVKGMVRHHVEGRQDYTFQIWSLLMLELWHRKFID